MSNLYVNEPPTNGKLILETSLGELEVELWPKEAPLATRNFIQLCLESYFDNCPFHRVIPGFIAQSGDPTGTGTGGHSIYGSPFVDEIHSRLRFTRRGLLAMANQGLPNSNTSQFFFTLASTPELAKKHTIFGKIVGDTIFNLMRISEIELDGERPLYPPRIFKTRVILNPFDDIQPRQRRTTTSTTSINTDDRKAVKNKKLLSFQGEDEDEDVVPPTKKKKKGMSMHELVDDPHLKRGLALAERQRETTSTLPTTTASAQVEPSTTQKSTSIVEHTIDRIDSSSTNKHVNKTQMEPTTHPLTSKPTMSPAHSILARENERLLGSNTSKLIMGSRNKKAATREHETMARLVAFQNKIKQAATTPTSNPIHATPDTTHKPECDLHAIPACATCWPTLSIPTLDDDGPNWMAHTLRFEKDDTGKNVLDPNARQDRPEDLVVIDPRQRRKQIREARHGEQGDTDKKVTEWASSRTRNLV